MFKSLRRKTVFGGLLTCVLLLAGCGATTTPTTTSNIAPGTAANSAILVSAKDLAAALPDPNLRIVDFGSADEYQAGHIPGATHFTWDQFGLGDTSATAIISWQQKVEQMLGAAGIAPTNRVVVYDHGTLWSARLWWVLDQLGHNDKQILDGGYAAWQAAGAQTSTASATYAATTYQGAPKPEILATAAQVQADLNNPAIKLVDARTPDEYKGQASDPRSGHIPGAVNLPYTNNGAGSPNYFKSPDDLKALYAAQGVTPDQQVIAYCSTGVRGAVDYVSLKLAGFQNVQLYTGSWAEWGSRADLPVEK